MAVIQVCKKHMNMHIFLDPNMNNPQRRLLREIGNGGQSRVHRVSVLSAPACCTFCDYKHLNESYSPCCISGINYTVGL